MSKEKQSKLDKSKFVCILDSIGRVVVGDVVKETKDTLSVNTPTIVHVQPDPDTGALSVSVFPYIFMEFIAPGQRDTNVWHFCKKSITSSDVVLDDKIYEAYVNLREGVPAVSEGGQDAAPDVDTDGSESNVVDAFG